MTDVFISHSSKDKHIADTVCAKLEQANIKCWMAPRDIKPGEEWAAAIMRGIRNCKCMVILFSGNSNDSSAVLSEVENAFSNSKVIVPFKISDALPTESMQFFLQISHWLDASDDKLDSAIYHLTETLAGILNQPLDASAPTPKIIQPSSTISKSSTVGGNTKWFGLGVFIVVAAGIGFYMFSTSREPVVADLNEIRHSVQTTSGCGVSFDTLAQQNETLLDDASRANLESINLISCQLPNREIAVKAWLEPNRSQFTQGDEVTFKVSLEADAFLAVYVHSTDGSTYLIYPNPFAQAKKLTKESVFRVGNGSDFVLEIAEPFGLDIVHFIATTDENEFGKLLAKHDALEGTNLHVTDRSSLQVAMKTINTRGIKVTAAKASSSEVPHNPSKRWGEAIILLHTRSAH